MLHLNLENGQKISECTSTDVLYIYIYIYIKDGNQFNTKKGLLPSIT